MTKLTTHILDTSGGRPAAGVLVELFSVVSSVAGEEAERSKLNSVVTNNDGRADKPLLAGDAFQPGQYELEFHVGAYFDLQGAELPNPKFLDVVIVRFGISDPATHYHVPLLVSPFGYSTYRGS